MPGAHREIISTRALLVAALLGWLAITALGLFFGPPLGHDEAAYAVAARAGHDVWIYRPDGMIAIARLGLWLGGPSGAGGPGGPSGASADLLMRVVPALLSLAALASAYALVAVACSARTAAWTVALLAGAHPMALRNAELLSDLPAMAGILAGMAVMLVELARPAGPRWRLLAAAPLFAAAFYVRYGSAPTIALAIAFALLRWRRAVRQRPAPFAAMIALLAALLVPHLLRAIATTGSPLGIVELSATVAHRAYLGDGLVEYLTTNPLRTFGVAMAPVMLFGLFAGLFAQLRARRATSSNTPDARGYFVAVALAQLFALGLQSHAEPRYLYVAATLLAAVGVDHLRQRAPAPRASAAAAAAAALAVAALGMIALAPAHFRRLADRRAPIVTAARAIAHHAHGRRCATTARPAPQLSWYSRCAVWRTPAEPLPLDGGQHYVASFAALPYPLATVTDARTNTTASRLRLRDPRTDVWHVAAASTER